MNLTKLVKRRKVKKILHCMPYDDEQNVPSNGKKKKKTTVGTQSANSALAAVMC